MRRRTTMTTILLALLAATVAVLVKPLAGDALGGQGARPASVGPAASRAALGSTSGDLAAVTARVSGSVVQIAGMGAPGAWTGAGGSLGSGFVVDTAGHVVTNAHVVHGARRLTVLLTGTDGGARVRRVAAQVVGMDEETDVALLRLTLPAGSASPPALELARDRPPRAGELVLAIGSPFGFKNSVSLGVVSATERQLHPERPAVFLQTDAPINPGSSGGPLVAMDGRVVGMSTSIVSESGRSDGVGFAVPARVLDHVVTQLRLHGRVRRGTIGVAAQSVSPLMAAALRLERGWGVILGDVEPDGPAHRAGADIGDIVVAVDGQGVTDAWQLDAAVATRAIGDTLRLMVTRLGQGRDSVREREIALAVPVAERVDAPDWLAYVRDRARGLVPELGFVGLDLAPDDSAMAAFLVGRRVRAGVLVAETIAHGLPASLGVAAPMAPAAPRSPLPGDAFGMPRFEPGDIIHWLDGEAVHRVDEIRRILRATPPGTAMLAHVDRAGRLLFVSFERP